MIDLNKIKDTLKDNFTKVILVNENDTLVTLETKYAKQKEIIIKSPKDISKYIENPYDKTELKIEYTGEKIINYNTEVGTKLGEVKITYKDEIVDILEIKLEQELNFSLLAFIKENIITIIIAVLVLAVVIIVLKKPKKKKRKKIVVR